jgi:uncharacterized damage-inducible protein DinB
MDLEGARLARLSAAVRESTLSRLRRVPPGREGWRIADGAMSFADLARHLVDADEWLFRKLRDPEADPMRGEPGIAAVRGRADFERILEELERTGRERETLLGAMRDARLRERIPDARFGGEVEIWWLIVRGNLDHEIHHRGQVAAYLASMGA